MAALRVVMVRHLKKGPVVPPDINPDTIHVEEGPKQLGQLVAALRDRGFVNPLAIVHSNMARTRRLAMLLTANLATSEPCLILERDLLGYRWLGGYYGNPDASWAAMQSALGRPMTECTAQDVFDVWPEATAAHHAMQAELCGLHALATGTDRIALMVCHTGILEMALPREHREWVTMMPEASIITFSFTVDGGRVVLTDKPEAIYPAALHPYAAPLSIELEDHAATEA